MKIPLTVLPTFCTTASMPMDNPGTPLAVGGYPQLRFISTKAAFAWQALMPNDSYTSILRKAVENLGNQNRGYLSGRYENSNLGVNTAIDVNTNAVILESLLYQARSGQPLAF